MSARPDVSVVISAYNAEKTIARCLDSILAQEGVDLEVVVVNDGSRDGTGALLDARAVRDSRLRVIHQENQGLTRALQAGCTEARGEFIARQDADDVSLPGRLAAQLARARAPDRPALVAVGCGCVSEEGDPLYEVFPPADETEARRIILEEGRSICCHGALLFPRDAYARAGGYRAPFYYAQDIDLILRLAALGPVGSVVRRGYDFAFSPFAISGTQHGNQRRFWELAMACRRAREKGETEASILEQVGEFSALCRRAAHTRKNPAAGYYFMGSCLLKSNPERAHRFFTLAWRHRPFWPRALLRMVQSRLASRSLRKDGS